MRRACRKLRILTAAIGMSLAACSTVPQTQPPAAPLPSNSIVTAQMDLIVTGQMEDILQYYDALRKQPTGELGRVYDKVKQNFVQNKSDANRARLVLLLILPNTPFRDLTSALYLLNEWPRDAKPTTGLQSFRNLLAALLAEQQRLNQGIDDLSQKLKEEQKRVETLQNQIEAIKSMEKNLILREL
ncbi:MAG: dihydrolipoamide acyltransferase [Pseudomonadota bacterium]|nr:dihydrolipoamide acyltransferase [Pseudomonadota bacterium]